MANTAISNVSSILISGASIAGPTLAYWLSRYGFDVTVVERSKAVRNSGYPVDVRGTAVDVAEQMGIYDHLQQKNIHSEKATFLHPDGSTAGVIQPIMLTGGSADRDIDLPRGDLTAALYNATLQQPTIAYRFDDSISQLHEEEDGVHVVFQSGQQEIFDLVIGADGTHSNTRRFLFGDEAPFSRYLGYCFGGFTVPNRLQLAYETVVYALPGRYAILSVVKDSDYAHAFLNVATSDEPPIDYRDTDQQRRYLAEHFVGDGWIVPELVEHMLKADDFYFDTVSQIHLPSWHKGRVALVGDAAYAPSFLTGQGSSVAMVGAYILAGELAVHTNYEEAFVSYEHIMRPFAERNQALANQASFMMPRTQEDMAARNQLLDALTTSDTPAMPGDDSGVVHRSLQLPDYSSVLQDGK
ncbi:FAD-dependent monooxygenase [Paenibacillus kandeliae]|uniref:FAD-dependent monooxygenase n=1 Tax=Paenibacillus kandeliae TaxID=3231269 RepID=UPI003457D680